MNTNKINPIELLELGNVSNINEDVIKTAKKKFKVIYGLNPSSYTFEWPDYERAIDALDALEISAYKEQINNPVAKFVETGKFSSELNRPFSISKTLKLKLKDDVNKKLSIILLDEFKSSRALIINSLTYMNAVADENEYFKGISAHLHGLFEDVNKNISTHFINKINVLPDWFNDDKSKFADKVRGMGIMAWNEDENIAEAFRLVNLSKLFNANETITENITKNITQLNKIQRQENTRKEEEKIACTCHYCKRKPANKSKAAKVKFYKYEKQSYTEILSRANRTFRYGSTTVPRCTECWDHHDSMGITRFFSSYITNSVNTVRDYFDVQAWIKEGFSIGDPNNEHYETK